LSIMDIVEITAKSALVRSKITGVSYVINPYLGCGHGCLYCYAVFMRKYSRHHTHARWGSFVECKANIVELLRKELARKKSPGTVMLSSVCDPYQSAEREWRLTRGCLEVLCEYGWEVEILTRSPLVLRDLDLLKSMPEVSVGFSVGTENEQVRRILEPGAPPVHRRIEAIKELHDAGIHTWVFIAPVLPMDPERLYHLVSPHVDYALIDALNYRQQVREVFVRNRWGYALTDEYAAKTCERLMKLFGDQAREV
jgi:DNA repair photolyase